MNGDRAARPTMKDVANRAGVALKTVSRVLNGEAGVTPDTAQRVRAAIEELDFRRNDGARVLRSGRTASVGLVLEDLGDPFYAALTSGVESVVHAQGCLLLTGSSGEDPEREQALALALCARRVDGLVISPASADHSYLLPDLRAGVAAVFVDRPPGSIEADVVLADNAGGARAGVAHLIDLGHRGIGYLGDAPHIFTAGERLRGYRQAMDAAGLPVDEGWIVMEPPTALGIRLALARLLSAQPPVTAVFCGNNRITVLVLRELTALGRERGTALVGFDDFELADLLGVTVVAQDPAAMGRIAAELLFRRLDGQHGRPQRIEMPTTLLVRGGLRRILRPHDVADGE